MCWGVANNWLKCLGISACLWFALPSLSSAQTFGTAIGICGDGCGVSCGHHCPPPFKYLQEGPPRIHFKHGCPHPVANPCTLPNWGYFETCWNPWPFPPNWNHCYQPPPASYVHLNAYGSPPMFMPPAAPLAMPLPKSLPPVRNTQPAPPGGEGFDELPAPRKLETKRQGLGN